VFCRVGSRWIYFGGLGCGVIWVGLVGGEELVDPWLEMVLSCGCLVRWYG